MGEGAPPSQLQVRGLSKRYGLGTTTKLVFHAVNADFPQPGVTLLYGPNGSGKTTLLRCLAGIASATSGTSRLACAGETRPAVFAYVPDGGRGFHADLSARENLGWAARMHGARLALAELGEAIPSLKDILRDNRPAKVLSRGQKQMLSIAMAFLAKPDFFLLDEPTNGLDPKAENELVDVLQLARTEGAGIVVATHNLTLQRIADKTVFMSAGKVIAERYSGAPVGLTCEIEVRCPGDVAAARRAGFEVKGWKELKLTFCGSAPEILTAISTIPPESISHIQVVDRAIAALYLESGQ